MMGVGEFLPSNLLIDCLASLFCHETITQGLCTNILFILCGFDEAQVIPCLLSFFDILHLDEHNPSP